MGHKVSLGWPWHSKMNATFAADRGSNPDWRSIHIVDIDFFGLFFAILWLIKTRLAKKKKIIIQNLVMYENVQKVVFNPNSIHVQDAHEGIN